MLWLYRNTGTLLFYDNGKGCLEAAGLLAIGSSATFIALLIFSGCQRRTDSVSGTIEVDEVHVAPRMGGRVLKIFHREGDRLKEGEPIVELDAAELPAQRNLAQAQVDAASRDAEAQAAQLQFLRA